MAKKKVDLINITPGQAAYREALAAIKMRHEDWANGNVDDPKFSSPGKQKKVAKQLAKLFNRLLKKSKLEGIEDLDEDDD